MKKSRIPKKVSNNPIEYPAIVKVKDASDWQIRHWYNTLPAPKDDWQIAVMKLIIKRNKGIRKLEALRSIP